MIFVDVVRQSCVGDRSFSMIVLAAGGWSEVGYHCITIGRATSSVRSLSVVHNRLWAAYRNCIIVIDPKDLSIKVSFILP